MSRNLAVSLFVALALVSQVQAANRVIYVVVDPAAHRAYIPEETVLPEGLRIRASAMKSDESTAMPEVDRSFRLEFAKTMKAKGSEPVEAPLIFEYAPAERFATARDRYEAKHRTAGGLGHPVANYDYC